MVGRGGWSGRFCRGGLKLVNDSAQLLIKLSKPIEEPCGGGFLLPHRLRDAAEAHPLDIVTVCGGILNLIALFDLNVAAKHVELTLAEHGHVGHYLRAHPGKGLTVACVQLGLCLVELGYYLGTVIL